MWTNSVSFQRYNSDCNGFKNRQRNVWIWCSHWDSLEDYSFANYFGGNRPTFQKSLLSPSSGQNSTEVMASLMTSLRRNQVSTEHKCICWPSRMYVWNIIFRIISNNSARSFCSLYFYICMWLLHTSHNSWVGIATGYVPHCPGVWIQSG
jgi:hypothetical protein